MNKKEKAILLDSYKRIYYTHELVGIDKSDSIHEFKFILNNLGLELDRYIIENKIIAEKMELKPTQEEAFEMMFNDCIKYGRYENYGKHLVGAVEELKFNMTEEEKKCNAARIRTIENKI